MRWDLANTQCDSRPNGSEQQQKGSRMLCLPAITQDKGLRAS